MSNNVIADFVKKKHKIVSVHKVEVKQVETPWYKRPIEREAFIVKEGVDGRLYVHHKEWSERVYIGPYSTTTEVNDIIDSYVEESLKHSLDKKTSNSIHSIVIENGKTFFKTKTSV